MKKAFAVLICLTLLCFGTCAGRPQTVEIKILYTDRYEVFTYNGEANIGEIAGGVSYIYFDDFSIEKVDLTKKISLKKGKVIYNNKSVFGIICGADNIIYDAYFEMKEALDENKKVVLILTDGMSLEQVKHFSEHLTLFGAGYKIAASVNPAISNVALASIITGGDPAKTEIYSRITAKPAVPDIFDYALQKGKAVEYLKTNSHVITNIEGKASFNDYEVFQKAITAKDENVDLLFVHFKGIDETNHEYSPESPQALEKILEIEGYVTGLLNGFTGKAIIVSDHGHETVLENGLEKGNHGLFVPNDMFVPYFVIDV